MRRAIVPRAVLALLVVGQGGCAWIERVSAPTGDPFVPGIEANGSSYEPATSDHAAVVAFESAATNLVTDDTNGVDDVFARDVIADTTERISVASDGSQASFASSDPSISDDGRFVAFVTRSQLSGDDDDSAADVYVRDRLLATTTLRSTSFAPLPPPFPASIEAAPMSDPVISGDGTTVAFNVTVDAVGFPVEVGPFVRRHDQTALQMTHGELFPSRASLSDDGSRIAWASVRPVGTTDADISLILERTTDDTLIALVDGGFVTHESQGGFSIELSGDGTKAVTTRTARGDGDVFRYDVEAATLSPVAESVDSLRRIAISDDGSRIVFIGTLDATTGLWLVEPGSGRPPRVVSADILGRAASTVGTGTISGAGAWVVFDSYDPAIVPYDTNERSDVFVRSVDPSPLPGGGAPRAETASTA